MLEMWDDVDVLDALDVQMTALADPDEPRTSEDRAAEHAALQD